MTGDACYRWFLALSGVGYATVALGIKSERTFAEFALFLTLFAALGGFWLAALFYARRRAPSVAFILLSGLLLRALMLPAGFDFERGTYSRLILYDDDVWRYLWEGHAWLGSVNPLRTAPQALEEYQLELDSPETFERLYDNPRWGEVWDNIGYRRFASPYPPAAHGLFITANFLAPASVAAWKALIIAFDLGSVSMLALLAGRLGQSTWAAAAYSWCPLPIKEFAGSGHVDAAMIFLLLAALYLATRYGDALRSGLVLALAALVKPTALAAAPGLVRKLGWRSAVLPAGALVLIAAYPPEGLKAYAKYWVFNPALPRLLPDERWLEVALPLAAAAAAGLWRYFREDGSDLSVARSTYWVLGAFLLTTPMLAPWYLCWILPFAALLRGAFWLLLSITVFLSYHAHLTMTENHLLWSLQFLIPLAGAWSWRRLAARGDMFSSKEAS